MSQHTGDHQPANCIVPPHILESIARRGTQAQRERARQALAHDTAVRDARQARLRAAEASAPPGAPEAVEAPGAAAPPRKHRSIYDAKNGTGLPGHLVRDEADPPTGDVAADEAYDGLGATWDLYQAAYGRNSYDNRGATITGTVHYRTGYDNAMWDGSQMVFGDGDGMSFNRFTIAVDVMGHELTHAVTQDESGLEYHDQPGALNESISDVFGSLVKQFSHSPQHTADQADWLIGAGLFTAAVNGVALRSMKAPGTAFDDPVLGKDPQPGHMDGFVQTSKDHGGVHINSGIPNHAFFLFATALGGFAWERAGAVWYATATDPALPKDSSFQQFADLTADHAYDLFGASVAQACIDAWAGVGITVRSIRHVDLSTAVPAAPLAAGDPFGYVFAAQGVQNVVYRGANGHLYGAWRAATRGIDDLAVLAGAPGPAGDPTAYVFDALGVQNVVYRGVDGHLHGLYWSTGAVGHDDLTSESGAPPPAGGAHGYVFKALGIQNVVYRGVDGHLHGLYWSTGAVGHDDLTSESGAPPPAGDPAAYYMAADATQHVFYRSADGHLHELWWTTGAVGHGDLTALTGAPPAAGDPTGYVVDADGSQHVFYRSADGHLHELRWG